MSEVSLAVMAFPQSALQSAIGVFQQRADSRRQGMKRRTKRNEARAGCEEICVCIIFRCLENEKAIPAPDISVASVALSCQETMAAASDITRTSGLRHFKCPTITVAISSDLGRACWFTQRSRFSVLNITETELRDATGSPVVAWGKKKKRKTPFARSQWLRSQAEEEAPRCVSNRRKKSFWLITVSSQRSSWFKQRLFAKCNHDSKCEPNSAGPLLVSCFCSPLINISSLRWTEWAKRDSYKYTLHFRPVN